MESATLARALGWFSVGLGTWELLGGGSLSETLGMEKQEGLLRVYGAREMGVGVGILASQEPPPAGWLWARFAGDVLDIATLAAALEDNPKRTNVLLALAAVGGVTVLDYLCAQQLSGNASTSPKQGETPNVVVPDSAPEGESYITINRTAAELYELWNAPENFARIMGGFAEVTPTSSASTDTMQWTVHAPLGKTLTWKTQPVYDQPNTAILWKSLEGGDVPNEGEIRFKEGAPGNRGTEVSLRFRFDPPGGLVGDALVKLLGFAPGMLASNVLRRFKALAETGEIPTLSQNVSARGIGDTV